MKFGVDRTSNRRWKRRRNYINIMRPLIQMNRPGGILEAVLETRPGLDREKAKQMIDALFDMRQDEELR